MNTWRPMRAFSGWQCVFAEAVSPKVPLSPRQISCGPVARRCGFQPGASRFFHFCRTIQVASTSTVRSPRIAGALSVDVDKS